MSFLSDLYHRSLTENEKNLRFWQDYLQNLKSLDLTIFADKLKLPALVPIGTKIFFRGEIKHTNEVIVALGADYFAKCSLKQAEELRQHRIKDAQSKIDIFTKEKQYLHSQIYYKQNFYENESQEIIEEFTEEEDKTWREKHRENVKRYKQSKIKDTENRNNVTDEELWYRLEELELREELENELQNSTDNITKSTSENSFIVKENAICANKMEQQMSKIQNFNNEELSKQETEIVEKSCRVMFNDDLDTHKQTFKSELLQQVIDRQDDLENKLMELKNKERGESKTQQELISKLDEMEQLDELEDEMNRLEDMLQCENMEKYEEDIVSPTIKVKRRVSFADEGDSETLELSFSHSDVEPCNEPYNSLKGILKPSDIYKAYSDLFVETTSILKKSKYEDRDFIGKPKPDRQPKEVQFDDQLNSVKETVLVKDIVEKLQHDNKLQNEDRPISLFKKRKQQKKS